jgi:small subunit ribosomal protein S20
LPAKARPKKNLSAMKRARQAEKGHLRNKSVKSSVKTVVKKVETALASNSKEAAGNALLQAIKAIDKAASKGVMHKNTASRSISRLTKKVNAVKPQSDVPAAGAA